MSCTFSFRRPISQLDDASEWNWPKAAIDPMYFEVRGSG